MAPVEALRAPAKRKPGPEEALAALIESENIAEDWPEDDLGKIAGEALEEYKLDKSSMQSWLDRMKKGIALAELIKEDKTYPWQNAANVAYPLVTTAALQFNAKAYPAIVPGDDIVKTKVFGSDPQGQKAARGERIAAHMSYQLLCKIEEWEEDMDKLLTVIPIVGTCIHKIWFDPAQQRTRVRLLQSGAFIVNDKVRTLAEAPRLTEELRLYPSEIEERKRSGWFRGGDYVGGEDESEQRDKDAAQLFIEQHRRLDLDGDGYAEPYIVTVHESSMRVARIVADFTMADVTAGEGGITAIKRNSYFVAFHMLPSLNGGFWGTGFGLLLGDISETINSIINQMLDAGHMASRGGGFIGSEFRLKGGPQQFKPGEWRTVGATGATIKDAIVPLTFPGPDKTLFELLGLLIEAGKEVASIKDILMGESGGKTMTATTTMALIEQGMAQFTAAYKRIYRALRHEFKLIAGINAQYVSPEEYNAFHDLMGPATGPDGQPMMGPDGQPQMQQVMLDPAKEYDLSDMDIVPVADPSSVTKMQKIAKAQLLGEMAEKGLVNPQAASQRMLEAASIENAEELVPQPDPKADAMFEAELTLKQAETALKQAQGMLAQAQAQAAGFEGMSAQAEAQLKQADHQLKQIELQIKAGEGGIKSREAAAKERETEAKIALISAQIEKIMAEIQQGNAELALKAKETEITETKTQAEIGAKGAEIDLQRQAAARDDRKTDAEIGLKGVELDLKKRDGDVNERKTAAEIENQRRALDQGDKSTEADTELKKAQAKSTLKPPMDPNKSDDGKPSRVMKIRVTKHDDKGRILEIEKSE